MSEQENGVYPPTPMRCRLCGKGIHEIGGYLHRINEKGVAGVWECRPACNSKLSNEEAILAAIKGDQPRVLARESLRGT